uniref:Tubulin tyrosine ligase-like family, member 5 n=1 Tax=Cynoglossus semilaevis TaxID=244447 RepID=A0A3P8UFV8_CYNSE
MIADMFSLVGFVCQDPLSKQPRSDRVTQDSGLKHSAAARTQKPLPAWTAAAHSRGQQKATSASHPETQGSKEKPAARPGQGDSTLSLTAEEVKVLRRIKEEYERRGGFIRIFPTAETWELYSGYLESKTSMNHMLANRLFHGRHVNGNVQLQVDGVHRCHVVQYERKLLSLEARKRRQRHLTLRSAAAKEKKSVLHTSGKGSKASPTESGPEGEESAREEKEEGKRLLMPVSHKALVAEQIKQVATPLERGQTETASSSQAAAHNARPRVDLLNILQQGWDLSKVQARMAFSSYLQRVQQRLLTESRATSVAAWPEKDHDHMELVIRFLKKAASNLQQDIKMVLPSRQLPLQDRRRILSHQLGEFIHSYNRETEEMVKRPENSRAEEQSIDPSVFQEYITAASESELEEVLTFYTQKNKSANLFIGTKVRSVKKDVCEVNASGDSGNFENSKTVSVAKEDVSSSESSLAAVTVSSDPDIKASERQPAGRAPSEEQQTAVGTGRAQPDVQASQRGSSLPVTSDCAHVHVKHCSPAAASLPLHRPPPQPPSYAKCLAKSQFCHPEALSDPPAYSSSPTVTQPQRVMWAAAAAAAASSAPTAVTTVQSTQGLRRIQSFNSPTSHSGAPSSFPSATHIYSQKFSRPTSAGQVNRRSSSSRPKSNPGGVYKEFTSLSTQAQSNHQSLISTLQKLADKQVARHYASSSHINLLSQHLSRLNLANRMLGRDCFTLNPKVRPTVTVTPGPVKALHSGTDVLGSTRGRSVKEDEGLWDGHGQNAYSSVSEVKPLHRHQPPPESYQLQFAIQQLQQQKLQGRLFLDQSHYRTQLKPRERVPHRREWELQYPGTYSTAYSV